MMFQIIIFLKNPGKPCIAKKKSFDMCISYGEYLFFRNLSPETAPKSPSFPQPYQLSIALQHGQDRSLSTSLP